MKKIVTHLIVFILFLIHYSTFAQKQNNQWQFRNSKINFNTNPPSVVASPPYYDPDGYYLYSSVADRNTGKLLFYATKSQVWNANNQKMSNGDMVKDSSGRLVMFPSGSNDYDYSPFIIVPKPGSSSLYYIITKSNFYNYDDNTLFSGIFYSVVDMTLNGGLGDVVLGQKNRLLFQTKGGGPAMAVIPASDGLSFWLIGSDTADALFSLKIDSKGFQATPVRYKIGVNFSDNASAFDLKINRQFNKLAFGDVERINILDFNNTTGVISNLISWQQYTTNGGLLSPEFSPNGKVLYVSSFLSLVQYDISKTTGVAIQNSAVVLEDITPGTGGNNGILQLASNNKIYCNCGNFLSVVNCPNKLGAACGFQPTAISLDTSTSSWGFYSLPPWVYYASDAPALISNSIAYSDSCFGRATQFFIKDTTGILNVTWNFGDSASGASNTAVGLTANHVFSKVGNYTVRAIVSNACGVDTLFLNRVTIINCVPITGFNIIGDTCNVATKFTFKPIGTTTADSLIWTFDDPNSGANSYISFPANPNALHTFSAAGIYKVCLILQEPGFPLDTVCKTVNIGQCCNGIITTKDSCLQNSIPFSIINDSTITSVTWNFGDSASGASNTAVGLTANHVFSKVGNYTVRAIVSNACGVDTLFLNRVTIINCVPITGFNIIGDTCNVAAKFTFKPIGTTTADSLIWTFDAPNSGANSYISFPANPNALHTFSAAGIYKVCLILQEPGFPLDTVCKTVNIGQCCNGIITTKDSCLQNSIPFSIINDSTITSVTWNFGDSASGASNTAVGLTANHVFSKVGNYTVRAIVSNACGVDTLFLNRVTIINCVPITGFNIIGDTCNVAAKFTFKPIGTTTADSLIWTFDDPNSGANSYISFPANPNALHTFSAAGIYKVCLILQEPGFPLDTVCKTVNIGQCCNGIITTKDSCLQNSIPFSIINDSTITSVTWNFGDSASGASNTSTSLTPTHLFSAIGTYNIRSIINSSCGIDTLFKTLAITSCDSTIDVCELSIANVFTPNGDGINDKFYPLTKCTTEQYEFFIYNRWGQLVYKTTNQTDKWDGKYREEDCSEGVYMYLIRYKYPTQPAKNVYGSISLLR